MRLLGVHYMVAGVFCAALILLARPSIAQDDASATAKRIQQLRDQASQAASASDAGQVLESAEPADSRGVAGELVPGVGGESSASVPVELPTNEQLPLGASEGDLFGSGTGQVSSGTMGDGWLLSTLAALGVVLAIVFGLRWVLRRGGVVSPSVSSGSVVEVLNRTTVAPRSHVVLMRVGQRILVVSDSTAGMRTLASVNEPEEVAALLGAIDAAKSSSMTQNFGSVMKKLSGQWADEETLGAQAQDSAEAPADSIGKARGALSQVRSRLASLTDSEGRRG